LTGSESTPLDPKTLWYKGCIQRTNSAKDLKMASSPQRANDHYQDLRLVVADAMNETLMGPHVPEEQRITQPVTPDLVRIPCQRTWYGISTVNSKLDGGDVSACVAHVRLGGSVYPAFVLVGRRADETEWRPFMSQGGCVAGGLIGPRSHVCIGGIDAVPDGGVIQVELADGTSYQDQASDGCCIVFAPITTPSTPDDHFTVRYLNPDGTELESRTSWIGDGKPPPGVRPAE
jgi:hypothetical protein